MIVVGKGRVFFTIGEIVGLSRLRIERGYRRIFKEIAFRKDIPVEAFNAYCWIHSTYIVSGAMLGVAGANVAYPGVASSFGILQTRYQDEDYRHVNDQTKRVKYYQWVAFVLIFQSISEYLILYLRIAREIADLLDSTGRWISS
ncbi:hypothetical protein HZH68_006025 [Vespula germanica]|uniref:Uncharacterized protein n=1 Tax=Vespula germanica TaxID=30212 RepID=A0A834KFZ4_VESGE|nr:hypothetical protein HZH68_006025 [Vespula germanica]